MSTLIDKVRQTMKNEDLEGPFELYVTRTPGYLWARLFRLLHVHPIAVTLMSIVLGAASGVCFYFESMQLTLLGIALLVIADWWDCADGQLARMTKKTTLIGRILDGFAGDVWFFFIYAAICLRLTPQWGLGIWLLAAVAGLYCHARQCAIADYYRNIHLWFCAPQGSELTTYAKVQAEYASLRWMSSEWFRKLYLFFYARYTRRQEGATPVFQHLHQQLMVRCGGNIPDEMRRQFRLQSRPLMKYTNILTFDTRVGVLFLTLLVGAPQWYFVFEIMVLDTLRLWLIRKHERICFSLLT